MKKKKEGNRASKVTQNEMNTLKKAEAKGREEGERR